jgi:A118 family predicted phage portal protein
VRATPTITQVIEAIGAPDAAKAWAKNIARWSYLYACRRPELTIELVDGTHKRRRRSLGMAKRVCEDWAGFLWTENASIEAGGDAEQAFLDTVFGEDFTERIAQDIEVSFAKGTGAIEILVDDLTMNMATGEMILGQGGDIDLGFVPAECIIPLKWNRGEIEEVAFISWCGRKVEVREHRGDKALRTITNRRFEFQDDTGLGKLREIEIAPGTVPYMELVDAPPMFAIISPAITNNIDPESPFGISIFANAEDHLDTADTAFDNFAEDMRLGGKMVFIPDTMLRKDKTTKEVIYPQADKQNLFVAIENATGETGEKITEYNPDLRVGDNKEAIEFALSMIGFFCGMGEDRYTFTGGGVKTATEVIAENSDLFRNRKKHLLKLSSSLSQLATAVLYAAQQFLGEKVDPSVEISVKSDDSVIEDDGAREARGLKLVAAGVLSERSFLVDYKGYTEEDADQEMALIGASSKALPLFAGA